MQPTATPPLRTARLELAALRPEDAEVMVGVLADPALYAWTGGEPPALDDLRRRYERLVIGHSDDGRERWHNWIVRLRDGGTAVGTVQATVSEDGSAAEIAWVIGSPWQGRGYATEAARALVGWLVGAGASGVTANVHQDHVASATVAARAGLLPTEDVEDGERVWRLAMPEG